MKRIYADPETHRDLIRKRRRSGLDRYDEMWKGVHVMPEGPDTEHQRVGFKIAMAFDQAHHDRPGALVYAGVNVSDSNGNWEKNYRVPDIAVYLPGNPAIDKGSYVSGGPDFAVEIVSPHDRSRNKFRFYAKVGTRELLIIDRYPWALELYRLIDGTLQLVGKSTLDQPAILNSEVQPLTFALVAGEVRPMIDIIHTQDARRWLA